MRRQRRSTTRIFLLLVRLTAILLVPLGGGCASFPSTLGDTSSADASVSSAAAEAYMRAAATLRDSGDTATAALLYQRAHEVDDSDLRPLVALAELAEAAGTPAAAAKAYRQAVQLAPDDGAVRRGYGKALLGLDLPSHAMEQYQAALRIDPDDTRAMNGLGVALDLLGQHEDAQETYAAGLAAAPGNVALRNNLALSTALTGGFDQAVAMLEEIAATPEHDNQVQQNIAMVVALADADGELAPGADSGLALAGEAEENEQMAHVFRPQRPEAKPAAPTSVIATATPAPVEEPTTHPAPQPIAQAQPPAAAPGPMAAAPAAAPRKPSDFAFAAPDRKPAAPTAIGLLADAAQLARPTRKPAHLSFAAPRRKPAAAEVLARATRKPNPAPHGGIAAATVKPPRPGSTIEEIVVAGSKGDGPPSARPPRSSMHAASQPGRQCSAPWMRPVLRFAADFLVDLRQAGPPVQRCIQRMHRCT